MDETRLLELLNDNYDIAFDRIEFMRDSGCTAYAVYAGECKYFLRVTKPAFADTFARSLDIQLFLQSNGFPVPPVIFAKGGSASVPTGTEGADCVLYEFIEGDEVDPEIDAEAIGCFVGQLHQVMKDYPGELVRRDWQFYIGRYLDIMRRKNYAGVDKFAEYADDLWKRLENLPMSCCHGDMYRGNILKTTDGKLYLLDLDTFCIGFPMYDAALICNMTDYFKYDPAGFGSTLNVIDRFMPEYMKENPVSESEARCICDLLALYHYALQATIIELYGIDCVDCAFFDRQYAWLLRWKEQCETI